MEKSEFEKMKISENSHWWYTARRELLVQLIPRKVKTLFEIGTGTGRNLLEFKKNGFKVEGLEIDKAACEEAKKRNLKVHYKPIEKFTFQKKYDLILMADVLEHIKDDERILKKINKNLEKNGYFLITVPAFQSLYSVHDELCHHYRRYGKKEFITKLKKAGFKIEKITYWNFFLFPIVALVKILKKKSKNAGSDISGTPKPINSLLKFLLIIENKLIQQNISLPFGISLVCLAKKI